MLTGGQKRFSDLYPEHQWSRPAVIDCTTVPRFGLRGRGSCQWLQAAGLGIPEAVNRAVLEDNGDLLLRLGQNEAMVSGFASQSALDMQDRWNKGVAPKGYDAFRRDSWAHILVTGPEAPALMAEVTEIDLRTASMPVGLIAQTRALQLDAVLVRTDRLKVFGYEIFFDISMLKYFLGVLRETAAGYDFVILPESRLERSWSSPPSRAR